MSHFYKPYFTAKYDPTTAKLYIAGQSIIESRASTGTAIGDNFTASTGMSLDNEIHLVPTVSWGDKFASVATRFSNDLTLNGVFDAPRFIDYINGKYVALTRFQVHTSTDLVTWESFDLPTFMQFFYRHKTKLGALILIKTGYYSIPVTTAAIHPDLSKVYGTTPFRLPEDFHTLPSVLMNDYWGTFGDSMGGYICLDGYWNPKPIQYKLYPDATYSDAKWNKVKLASTEIFAMLQFTDLNTHWDPNAYDSYTNDFTGAYVSDYRLYQFICCDEGVIRYRLLSNLNYNESSYSAMPFDYLYLPVPEKVYYVALYKFTYDYDTYYQSQSSYVLFERHYAFTETGIYELIWSNGTFTANLVCGGITGKPICIQTEYRSKWSSYNYWGGSLTGLPEIRKMHIYYTNGTYAVIDASDRTQAPAISSSNMGTNFVNAFVEAIEQKTAFVTDDNKIYIQTSPTSINYLTEVPHEVIGIKPSTYASYIEICTMAGVYHYSQSQGLSDLIRYEIFIPVQNFYNSGWHEEWYPSVGTISYVNNHYLYISQLGELFFTTDFLAWNKISSYGSLGNYDFSVPSGVMNWKYMYNRYVLFMNNSTQFLNSSTGEITYGLDASITSNLGTTIPLGNKLLIPAHEDGTTAIYNPDVVIKGLKTPMYNLPVFNSNSTTLMELTRLTFTTFVNRPYISIEAYGRYKGIEIWIEVTPVTGQAILYPILYGGDATAATDKAIHRTHQFEYTDVGNYTSGIKTMSIVFYRQPWSAVDMSLVIQSIAMDGITTLEHEFNQQSWSTSGDTWNGIVISPKQFRYYKYAGNFGINSAFIAALYNNDNKPISFVRVAGEIYMLKYAINAGSIWPANPAYTLNKYNTQTETFEVITDQFILDTFIKFKPPITLYSVSTLSNYCTGWANGHRLFCTDSTGKARVDNTYLMLKKATSYTQLNTKETAITGVNGTLAIKNMVDQFYQVFTLDVSKTLKKAIQYGFTISGSSTTRVTVIGSDGYLAYSDDVYYTWSTISLGSDNLNDILVDIHEYIYDNYNYYVVSLIYKLLVVGDNGFAAYSLNNGASWTNINLNTSSSLIGIIKFSISNTYVIYGKNFIAVSTDMVVWNTIVTGLSFEPLTALEYNGKIYIGCKNGKIIVSSNLTYWEYKASDTASDILQLYYASSGVYSGSYVAIYGVLKSNVPLPANLFQVGDTFYTPGVNNSENLTQGYTITAIEDKLFTTDPSWDQNQYYFATLDLCKLLTWREVFKAPAIKAYKDANCTQEINTSIYPADESNNHGSYSVTVNPIIQYSWLRDTVTVGFSNDVDVATIQYIFYPAQVLEYNWDTEKTITYNTLLILEVVDRDFANNTVTTAQFKSKDRTTVSFSTVGAYSEPYMHSYYNATGRINSTGILGIPYNSLYAIFTEDYLTCESPVISIWFKNSDGSKVYDNLLLTSKLAGFTFNYSFLEYVNAGINTGRSLIHNANIVRLINEPDLQVQICTIDELKHSNPYLNEIQFNNPNTIQLLNEESKILSRGLQLTISKLHVFESNKVAIFNSQYATSEGYYHEDFYHKCPAIAELRNKHYEPTFWSSNVYDTGSYGRTAQLVKSTDIRTVACTCRFIEGDTAGNGYYYLRCVPGSGTFKELQDIQGYLLFNDFVIGPYAFSQNGTQIGGWGYVDENTLVFYPYMEYGQGYWQVTFRMTYMAFTGPLQYITTVENFDYTSDLKQSFYEFTCGQLEFNIDQFPTIWKKAYELPPITGTETLKVNIRSSNVVNGVKILPYNILRLSGVEYNV